MTEITDIVVADDVSEIGIREYDVSELVGGDSLKAVCSVKADDPASKAIMFNAATNPDYKLKSCINKKIRVKDLYAETIELMNEETGEIVNVPRIVLIDDKGASYECVSVGMFSAIRKLVAVYGEPTWDPPLEVTVKEKPVGKGSMLTLQM